MWKHAEKDHATGIITWHSSNAHNKRIAIARITYPTERASPLLKRLCASTADEAKAWAHRIANAPVDWISITPYDGVYLLELGIIIEMGDAATDIRRIEDIADCVLWHLGESE